MKITHSYSNFLNVKAIIIIISLDNDEQRFIPIILPMTDKTPIDEKYKEKILSYLEKRPELLI